MEKSSIPDAWRWEGGRKLVSIILTTVYHFQRSVKCCVYTCVCMNRYIYIFLNDNSLREWKQGMGEEFLFCLQDI